MGAYTVNLENLDYNDITKEFFYNIGISDKSDTSVTITINNDIPIPSGQSLFIIMRTSPQYKPTYDRDALKYSNKLQNRYSNTAEWIDNNTATTPYIYTKSECFKELGCIFTYDGSNLYNRKPGTISLNMVTIKTKADVLLGDVTGTFIAWQVHVNYGGTLEGNVRVTDYIPEGMELAYVRYFWYGTGYNSKTKPTIPIITQDLPDGYEFKTTTEEKDFNTKIPLTCNYYYDSTTRTVFWDVDNLKKTTNYENDEYAAEFQIVCRVTDPDVIFGNTTSDKEFTNTVELSQGELNKSDTDTVFFQKGQKLTSFDKTITNKDDNNGILKFQIEVNKLGENLLSDKDTITLVDELSRNLILDVESVKVVDKNNEPVPFTYTIEYSDTENVGQIVKFVMPDNKYLTITYDTIVHAPPEQPISVQNNAYWEDYPTTKGSYSNSSYYYTASSAGSSGIPAIRILKLDETDSNIKLKGAEFSLQQVTYNSETQKFEKIADSSELTGITSDDGSYTFDNIQTNVIYSLTETKAPPGYLVNNTSHYIAFNISGDDNSNFLDNIPDNIKKDIFICYTKTTYSYPVYNASIKMPETGISGISTNIFFIIGGCIILIATYLYILFYRKINI